MNTKNHIWEACALLALAVLYTAAVYRQGQSTNTCQCECRATAAQADLKAANDRLKALQSLWVAELEKYQQQRIADQKAIESLREANMRPWVIDGRVKGTRRPLTIEDALNSPHPFEEAMNTPHPFEPRD